MDDVMNVHREVVYGLRRKILEVAVGNKESEKWFISKLKKVQTFDEQKHWEKNKVAIESWEKIVAELSLPVIDLLWMEHLVDMDHVRDGIGLRGYAQRDPIVEYKREGHERFEVLVGKMYNAVSDRLSKISDDVESKAQTHTPANSLTYERGMFESGVSEEAKLKQKDKKVKEVVSGKQKVGRNDPCPCGSGKKYKKCHGK